MSRDTMKSVMTTSVCNGIVVRVEGDKVRLEVSMEDGERLDLTLSIMVAARMGHSLLDAARAASASMAWKQEQAEEAKKATRS